LVKFIAEVSANHHGSIDKAKAIIHAAANAGADMVKFQTWTPDTMAIPGYVMKTGPWKGQELNELYRQAHTPWEWMEELFGYARSWGITPFASPFDAASVDFLETIDCPAYKVASFELVDTPLIRYLADKNKPIYLSTGMATMTEIKSAVRAAGKAPVTLLLCTSAYPAKPKSMHLRRLAVLQALFPDCKIGLSDHSMGHTAAVLSTPYVSVIEKHLTLSRDDPGPDSSFSMEPEEFEEMVIQCRTAEDMLGESTFRPKSGEHLAVRRSVYFADNLEKGTIINDGHIKTARPNMGISPVYYDSIIGKILNQDVEINQPTGWDCFEE